MGYLEELNTIIKNAASVRNIVDKNKHKSITRGALDGTLQFPCLISDAIPIDMASTIARTLERVYASFVQTYLSTNNTIDISVDKNPNMFLKRFHRNIKLESTTEDLYQEYCTESDEEYDKLMERIYNGSTQAYINERENTMILFNFSGDFNREVFESHKEALEESLSAIDFAPFPNIGNSPFYEAGGKGGNGSGIGADDLDKLSRKIASNLKKENDVDRKKISQDIAEQLLGNKAQMDKDNRRAQYVNQGFRSGTDIASKIIDIASYNSQQKHRDKMDALQQKQREAHDIRMHELRAKSDLERDKFRMRSGGEHTPPSILKDNDVKKSNDLQPYTMQVRLMAINDKDEFVQFMDFIVGVKVVLHAIKSDEMIINLQNALQNNGVLFNFIRWTTGEKSLFKDLILRINDVKIDVANKSRGTSPWWMTLKRLKETSRAEAAFFKKTQLVPQSTIVISGFDADSIEKTYGYNLRNPKFAIKLMKSLFLMNFIIVDEGTRTLDILYDGETAYQTYALETLEREVTMNSNKIGKELTRMISR